MKLQCDMAAECCDPVTHIGERGFIYCAAHAIPRRTFERTRKLRQWEIDLLHLGGKVPSYEPIIRREAMARVRA